MRAAVRLIGKAGFGALLLTFVTLVVGPRLFPFQTFYVRSGSMTPTLPVGALVVAERTAADQLEPGDVIVFERPDQRKTMVVHRIESVEETPAGRAFVTRGDANSTPDGWQVPATGKGWRAVYSMSRAGFAVGYLHAALSRRGWLGTVAIFAAVYALIVIWRAEAPA